MNKSNQKESKMPPIIEATQKEIMHVFDNEYLFEIPHYQRPYAWTTEEVDDLLDDIKNAVNSDDQIDNLPPYFFGSIVLIKTPKNPNSQVVDGQQRLTTLTILLCALREVSESEILRDLDNYVCQLGNKAASIEDNYRLNLRERDRIFFRDNVQKIGQLSNFLEQNTVEFTDSQKRIHENATYIWNWLSNIDDAEREKLAQFLIQRCYLVVVSASDRDSAYRIFAVMNDRGLDLSPTDILKAEIIGEMPEGIRDNYTNKWEEIEDILGRDDFHDLFSHIRMIYMKTKARRSLSQEFRDGVLNQDQVDNNEFIDNILTPMSAAYRIISKIDYASPNNPDDVNAYLQHLHRIDNSDWIPSAILYFKKHQNNEENLIKFIQDLERLAYGLFILRKGINDRIYRYAKVLNAIDNDDDLYTEDSPLQLSNDEKTDILNCLNGFLYLQSKVCKPVLLRLDSLLADRGVVYEKMIVTIEHVLPRQPAEGSMWLEKERFFDDEIRDEWTHKIANLVLLSRTKNSQAQNFDFQKKKDTYFQGNNIPVYALTTQVINKTDWNPEILKERQTELVNILAKEWRLQ